QKYRDYLLLDALLRWDQPEAVATPGPPPMSSRRRWGRGFRLVGVLAASLLLVVSGYLVHSWQPWLSRAERIAPPPGHSPEPRAAGLAVLVRSGRAQWAPTCPPLAVGATLTSGPLRLQAGLVQLEFYSGATLVVEGPADLDLLATNRLRCRAGKLR